MSLRNTSPTRADLPEPMPGLGVAADLLATGQETAFPAPSAPLPAGPIEAGMAIARLRGVLADLADALVDMRSQMYYVEGCALIDVVAAYCQAAQHGAMHAEPQAGA